MPNILLTGANGFIGQTLARKILLLPGMQLMATSASDCHIPGLDPVKFTAVDITRPDQVESLFSDFKPDIVIHCAAISQVDTCELDPDLCDRVNIEGTRYLAWAAELCGARFIFLSTDFVFDGLNGPYREDDLPNPVNNYGWSKLQGEFITQSLRVPWVIVRTILVYGFNPARTRGNLVTWVVESLRNNRPVNVAGDQYRMPTLVDSLADGIIRIVEQNKTGIFHLSGPDQTSVYDFALQAARFFQLDESLISMVSSDSLHQSGRRPPSTGFVLDKAIEDLGFLPVGLSEGLAVVRNLLDNYSVTQGVIPA